MTLRRLERIIQRRMQSKEYGSYTRELVESGPRKIAKKIGEEAIEVALEVVDGNKHSLIGEAADLFYHLLVGLAHNGVNLKDVYIELDRRDKRKKQARYRRRIKRKRKKWRKT
jgi:phosphoribosyl-ATP pyrophosphohydrolase/phosphoribosyl-AMP cyclohydrolase